MDADGGTQRFPVNTAGAAYGTGYCNAQCQKSVKFINGEANLNGTYGSCCTEMDIWEANSMATHIATHPCSTKGQERCLADEDCGATDATKYTGWCDKPGCSLGLSNGQQEFLMHDNTDEGELVEIHRLYKQDDRVVGNPASTWPALNGTYSVTESMCNTSKAYFNDHPYVMGGLAQLGKEMVGGMTLAMSIWVDYGVNMTWLDSYSSGENPEAPGVSRGGCPNPGGDPDSEVHEHPFGRLWVDVLGRIETALLIKHS
ncbi:unnamed protein product [Phytophthora lilii]|uniref:cellulose 1,4-beta-cellobiosidase (non-reducing end) n=1 Tax=Phytophthora lilii TaxID=2077276 RepID=A0A9W6WV40_9STRA|nr:unnamed protein product [Phytophthora lilii]